MTPEDFLKKWALASPVYEGLPAGHPGSPLADLNALLEAERATAREAYESLRAVDLTTARRAERERDEARAVLLGNARAQRRACADFLRRIDPREFGDRDGKQHVAVAAVESAPLVPDTASTEDELALRNLELLNERDAWKARAEKAEAALTTPQVDEKKPCYVCGRHGHNPIEHRGWHPDEERR